MLTENFYTMIAATLKGVPDLATGLYIAVGEGEASWDTLPPDLGREVTKLTRETARKQVGSSDITYLDETGAPTNTPTPRIRIEVTFGDSEAIGSLRECGLYGVRATNTPDSGTILSYYTHPVLVKTGTMSLERAIRVDLTPSQVVSGSRVTRYLGNIRTEEVHDLDNLTTRCQVDEIRIDHRYYFSTPEQALSLGYDRCAYCFGRDLSTR